MAGITASKGTTKPREKVTEGSHDAILVRVVDLGTQQPSKNSKFKDPSRQIQLVYEILDQTITINGEKKPMWVYEKISPYISTSKITNYHKKLNQLSGQTLSELEAENFDFQPLLGNVYTIQVSHNLDWENVVSVTKASPKLAEAYKDYETPNDMFFFNLEDFNEDIYNKLGDKTRDTIAMSPEFQEAISKSLDDGRFGEDDLIS